MKTTIYQIDAFTDTVFSGNPAAVCPLKEWLSDEMMQSIAAENNLAETAFYIKKNEGYHIRWFTPTHEVDLCGHATLASAFVLFHFENHKEEVIHFETSKSGKLSVTKEKNILLLNFPSDSPQQVDPTEDLFQCFDQRPTSVFKGISDYIFIYNSEQEIKNMVPRLEQIAQLDCRGVIITGRGDQCDFVSRFFAPQIGVDEDPVTGSAHTTLTPYWSSVLDKQDLRAIQLSQRGGTLWCKDRGSRVEIGGSAQLYLKGEIFI